MLVVLSVMEQRYEAAMAVLRDGLTVVEVAERFGVARQSVHRWIRRYEAAGLAGLGPVASAGQLPASDAGRGRGAGGGHPGASPGMGAVEDR